MRWFVEHIDDVPDGAVLLADHHEGTRGRQSREWKQYSGQLLLTILLKPDTAHPECPAKLVKAKTGVSKDDISQKLHFLNMAITLGILGALKEYGTILKWPNDFMLHDKKIGGMLLQAVWQENTLTGVIVGIGINVNSVIPDDDQLSEIATSIFQVTGKKTDVDALQTQIFESIDDYYQRWKNDEFDAIFYEWQRLQGYRGRQMCVHKKDGSVVRGVMNDVLPTGDLVLNPDSGEIQNISFCIVETVDISKNGQK